MSKKILIAAGLIAVIAIGGLGAAILFFHEDPLATQAKEEVRRAEVTFSEFQNRINAIPARELSEDVKNDFKMEAAYYGALGYINPGEEGASPKTLIYLGKLTMAANARASAKLPLFNMEDFTNFLKNASLIADVAREDLGMLEKTADMFDESVKQAKANVPALTPLTVERNKKTEKYFLEFERTQQKINSFAATLEGYSSSELRTRIQTLKSANSLFSEFARYTYQLVEGTAPWTYPMNAASVFPEVKDLEDAIRRCARFMSNPQGECVNVGPFPTTHYQLIFQRLESLYSALIEG